MPETASFRLGVDIGGTFTDFVLVDDMRGTVHLHKCLTTPDDPSVAALEGISAITAAAGVTARQVAELVHGTTLVTNAIIERRGTPLGLITTRGFRDLLEIGTEQRYDIYDLFLRFPEPLVPRHRRLEVTERLSRDGEVIEPLDEAELRTATDALIEGGAQAVAICFLHAYRDPRHERRAAELIAGWYPELALSLSSEVVPELWEYQRCVTTCANAYVQPLVATYLERLEHGLGALGFAGRFRLMHSGGGLLEPETARRFPIRLLESGPAGGGLAAAFFGARIGLGEVIAFDMGGTTAKACLIEHGEPDIAPMMEAARVHRFKRGSGLPIKAPVIDMIEIGAGGGSIAAVDEVGLLRVGPRSAGAAPGPACYGMGGTEPTVTDANVVLGYYDPAFFLGGRMRLDADAARRALERVAGPLGLTVTEAALGIHRLVTEAMASATRVHLVERGRDPRQHALVGFGGAGPAHGVEVARLLGASTVLIPPASGAASALGFLTAPLTFEQVRSQPTVLSATSDFHEITLILEELEAEARAPLLEAGLTPEEIEVSRFADMRLKGQLHELEVPWPSGPIDERALAGILADFESAYTQRYTAFYEGAQPEVITYRVRCRGPRPSLTLADAPSGAAAEVARKGSRRVWFSEAPVEAAVYDRYALPAGSVVHGPAIIEELEATTLLPPGDRLSVDRAGNLVIEVRRASEPATLVHPETPVAEARAAIEASPITLEIMWSRLVNVVEEMWLTICRTSFSLIISEAQDFACELLDPDGETLAHSPRSMPVFNLAMPRAVKALLEHFPPETLEPGDVLTTNDPWLCAGHLFDIAVITPVFRDGRLVALVGTVGHVSDIGGTKDSLRAREVFEEGLLIPPMKLFKAGALNEDLVALLRHNVRNPTQVLGDLHAFVAANRLGAERLLHLMRDYGMHDVRALAAVVQDRAEAAMRAAIRKLENGVFQAEVTCNPDGEKLTLPLTVRVEDERITLDFDGAPGEIGQGGFNCTLNYTAAHATYPLKCMLTPEVRGNAGCYRAFEVSVPEGSVLNCAKPMAVNLRTRVGWYLAPLVFKALAEAAPEKVQAHTGLPVAINIYGRDALGRIYSDHLFSGGGQGASHAQDGRGALLWPTSAANTSIELVETRVPILVLEKAFIPDSGGPGMHRGGLGTRVRLRKLLDDGLATLVSVYPEGVDIAVNGLFGGRPGGASRGRVVAADGTIERDCGAGELVTLKTTDRVVELEIGGGSGYGHPADRSADATEEDRAAGYATA